MEESVSFYIRKNTIFIASLSDFLFRIAKRSVWELPAASLCVRMRIGRGLAAVDLDMRTGLERSTWA